MNYAHILTRLSSLLQASTEERLLEAFRQVIAETGGTAFDIVVARGPADSAMPSPRGLIGWCEHHEVPKLGANPCGSQQHLVARPLFWNDVQVEGIQAIGCFIVGDTPEFGMVDGLMAPVPVSPNGSIFVEIDTTILSIEAAHWLTILCVAFHTRLSGLRDRNASPAPGGLSEREQQVLHWMAEGKSAEDVAEILGISQATVMFHYRNVASRYRTLNRTHTVVEALRRGALALT